MSKTAILFPGQGAQTVGMGRELFDANPKIQDFYAQANEIVGYDLTSICFEGPKERLDSTVESQPAIFVTSLAALEGLKETEPDVYAACSVTAGLSLGEYTALVLAGVLSFEDGLRLVQIRGKAMQQASDQTQGGMVSILGLNLSQIEQLCQQAAQDEILVIANDLCPGNTTVSGAKTACARLIPLAEAAGAIKTVSLAVAGAFHTSLMSSAVELLRDALAQTEFRAPRIPVISNVDTKTHDDPEEIKQILLRQIVSPVRWEESMRNLLEQGYDTFYEIGPGRVLRGLMKRINRKVKMN